MRIVLHHQQHGIIRLQVVPVVRDLLHAYYRQYRRLEGRARRRGDDTRGPHPGTAVCGPGVGERQVESESAAAAGNAAQADLSAEQMRELAADRKAEPRAAVLARGTGI